MISFDTAMGLTHKLTDAQAKNVLNQILGVISMEPGIHEVKEHCAEFIEHYVLTPADPKPRTTLDEMENME
jgi:hypothetical protein